MTESYTKPVNQSLKPIRLFSYIIGHLTRNPLVALHNAVNLEDRLHSAGK